MALGTHHVLAIDRWQPTRLNQLLHEHWGKANRRKKADRELVGFYALIGKVPPATGPRRVSLRITLAPGQRAGDPDSYWKSTLDALVGVGLLLDDNRQNCELGGIDFDRGPERSTAILLEDLDHA
jgi:hypothetical protein